MIGQHQSCKALGSSTSTGQVLQHSLEAQQVGSSIKEAQLIRSGQAKASMVCSRLNITHHLCKQNRKPFYTTDLQQMSKNTWRTTRFFRLINFSGCRLHRMMLLAAVLNIPDLEMVGQQLRKIFYIGTNQWKKKTIPWCSTASMLGKSSEGRCHVWISRQSISVMTSTVSSCKRVTPQQNTWSRHSFWVSTPKNILTSHRSIWQIPQQAIALGRKKYVGLQHRRFVRVFLHLHAPYEWWLKRKVQISPSHVYTAYPY